MTVQIEPIEDLVGELFVNRQKELQLCRKWVENIPRRHGNSYALVGRRRTGKTAILIRFFNQLFYEQNRVLPVYVSFARYMWREKVMSYYDFADEYFSAYLRSYLAFKYQKPLLFGNDFDIDLLWDFAREVNDEYAIELCGHYKRIRTYDDMAAAYRLVQWVINFPMGYARTRNMPTAIIIDEFQVLTDVYDPIQNINNDLTDSFQRAVETHWAPVLVSGSAVSLLVSRALTGMLSGRFKYHYLKPLSREYAHDLVFRQGDITGTPVTEELAEAMYQITEGYPYTISAMMNSECPAREDFPSLEALTEVMRFELTDQNGELWQHYYPEFEKYSHYLNTGLTTRRVMLWATKYPEQRIDADLIAQKLGMELTDVLRVTAVKLRTDTSKSR
ncbi:MAG: ATP-binding protein [Desulfobacteraceae bacterium]|nr:ATP-binding protein [Desulfobacteraceae bacterium]